VYKITTHHEREHTHLAYKLEMPSQPGDVQVRAKISIPLNRTTFRNEFIKDSSQQEVF
jgi:hypothetical protein